MRKQTNKQTNYMQPFNATVTSKGTDFEKAFLFFGDQGTAEVVVTCNNLQEAAMGERQLRNHTQTHTHTDTHISLTLCK